MTNVAILATIDEQIAKLQRARALLTDSAAPAAKRGPGRPKKAATSVPSKLASTGKKRVLSEEAKARIAAGQKKRWAAVKKASKQA